MDSAHGPKQSLTEVTSNSQTSNDRASKCGTTLHPPPSPPKLALCTADKPQHRPPLKRTRSTTRPPLDHHRIAATATIPNAQLWVAATNSWSTNTSAPNPRHPSPPAPPRFPCVSRGTRREEKMGSEQTSEVEGTNGRRDWLQHNCLAQRARAEYMARTTLPTGGPSIEPAGGGGTTW